VEALFLHEQGIEFEVIPGVPATIAAPAYAGIPVTYPGGGDTLVMIRGYERQGRDQPRVDWAALARIEGTIVSFAGPSQLNTIVQELLSNGRPGDESAAIIRHGTLLNQRTETGTLQELSDRLKDEGASTPGVLVVGNVVGLRDHLRWFDERPLFGRRVLVTRSRDQAGELVDLLEAQGAEAVEAPLIDIVPPDDFGPLDAACERAGAFDWIVLTSANGATAFMDRLLKGPRDVRALAGARLCAVGPGTASRLTRFGLKVDLIAEDHSASGVVAALKGIGPIKGKRVLFPKADIARETLPEELRAAGAEVTEVVAYRTVTAEGDVHLDIYRQLLERHIDAVTFSSASAVRAFASIYGADQAVDLLGHTIVATIGPVTTDAALRYGITPQVTPSTSTISALVEALVNHFRAHAQK
jgi:uroporphyrinogen III methyltransferase/synthase